MKINTIPVEAYRQAGQNITQKDEAAGKKAAGLQDAENSASVTIAGQQWQDTYALKLDCSANVLQEALSGEERDALMQHFARYGDRVEDDGLYGTGVQARQAVQVGQKLDVRL